MNELINLKKLNYKITMLSLRTSWSIFTKFCVNIWHRRPLKPCTY